MQSIDNLKIQEQVSKFSKKLNITKIDSKYVDILNKTVITEIRALRKNTKEFHG